MSSKLAPIVPFTARGPFADADFVVADGYKLRLGVCVVRERHGEVGFNRCKTMRDARWPADEFFARFADEKAFEANPLITQMLTLPKEAARKLGRWLLLRGKGYRNER